jgi:hypothetical protein
VTSCIGNSAAIYITVAKFRNTSCPPAHVLLHRRAVLSTNSKGIQSVYSRKNLKSSLQYNVIFLCSYLSYQPIFVAIKGRHKQRRRFHHVDKVVFSQLPRRACQPVKRDKERQCNCKCLVKK